MEIEEKMREIDCEIHEGCSPNRLFWLQFTMEMLLHDFMKGSNEQTRSDPTVR